MPSCTVLVSHSIRGNMWKDLFSLSELNIVVSKDYISLQTPNKRDRNMMVSEEAAPTVAECNRKIAEAASQTPMKQLEWL